MSLRHKTHATDKVTVIRRENQIGRHGRLVPVETGRVECWGRIQPSTTDEILGVATAGETQVLTMKNFLCRTFPGDSLSQVLDSNGMLYNIVGEPERFTSSRLTARTVVRLKQATQTKGV